MKVENRSKVKDPNADRSASDDPNAIRVPAKRVVSVIAGLAIFGLFLVIAFLVALLLSLGVD